MRHEPISVVDQKEVVFLFWVFVHAYRAPRKHKPHAGVVWERMRQVLLVARNDHDEVSGVDIKDLDTYCRHFTTLLSFLCLSG